MDTPQVTSTFRFENLTLKRGDSWRLKLKVYADIPETFREFDMSLSLDERPFEKEIAYIEKQKEERIGENQIPFKGELKKDLKDFDAQIEHIQDQMKELAEQCPTITAPVSIEQIKYINLREVDVVLLIPSTIVNEINDVRNLLKHYKIELNRE